MTIAVGRGLMDVIEMAPETAMKCKEKPEGRSGSIVRGLRRNRSKPFRRPQDVVHQAGNSVAKDSKMVDVSFAFAPCIRPDGLAPFRPDL